MAKGSYVMDCHSYQKYHINMLVGHLLPPLHETQNINGQLKPLTMWNQWLEPPLFCTSTKHIKYCYNLQPNTPLPCNWLTKMSNNQKKQLNTNTYLRWHKCFKTSTDMGKWIYMGFTSKLPQCLQLFN